MHRCFFRILFFLKTFFTQFLSIWDLELMWDYVKHYIVTPLFQDPLAHLEHLILYIQTTTSEPDFEQFNKYSTH